MTMTTPPRIPRSVDDITAPWLHQARSRHYPDIEVTALEVREVIWGTSTKVLVIATYAHDSGPDVPGRHLCVKGEFDEHTGATMGQTTTQREAEFYTAAAAALNTPLPKVWHADAEEGAGGVLILDDLTTQGVSFGDPANPASLEEVEAGLSVLAALHGSSWGENFDPSLISFGSADFRLALEMLFSEPNWNRTLAEVDLSAFPHSLKNRQTILDAYEKMFALDAQTEHCVLHGDAHIGNTYRAPDGMVYFIDWPTVCLGDWAYDVSYYIAGSLAIDDRRAREKDLLKHYLAALHDAGGPQFDFDEAWVNYGKHLVRGIIWATLPSTSQPMNRVQPMTDRYVAAMADHQTLSLLDG